MLKQITPPNLLKDQNIKALIEAIDPEFEKVKKQIINTLIYPRIDQLSEEILDLLAYQFHIEGYDLAVSIEEKRNLIKKAIELHRYKGTKYAILEVLKALSLDGQVKEWYEYNGQPYRFKVNIFSKGKLITPQTEHKLINLIYQYKNERSHLEKVSIGYEIGTAYTKTRGGFVENSPVDYFAVVPIQENFAGNSIIYAGFVEQSSEVFSNG